jgi:copper resistance protein C
MKALTIMLAGALLMAAVGNARAHSFPASETPPAGATLSAAPPQVAIRFDAPIEHLFAQLRVLNPTGKNVAAVTPEIDADSLTLSVKLPALQPGHYTVEWAVVCIDTHHTNGSYEFTVTGVRS